MTAAAGVDYDASVGNPGGSPPSIGAAGVCGGGSGGSSGASGGAVHITATGTLTILPGGSIEANGGAGGGNQNVGASGGGGAGSGGSIWLSGPLVTNLGSVSAAGGLNSHLNGAGATDGIGSDGRIRTDTGDGLVPAGVFDPPVGYTSTF